MFELQMSKTSSVERGEELKDVVPEENTSP